MQFKVYLNTIKFCKSSFTKRPKVLNTIDMITFPVRPFSLSMVESYMPVISNIHQSRIYSPVVSHNDSRGVNSSQNHWLQDFLFAVWYYLSVHPLSSFIDAKHWSFIRSYSSFTWYSSSSLSSKVGL